KMGSRISCGTLLRIAELLLAPSAPGLQAVPMIGELFFHYFFIIFFPTFVGESWESQNLRRNPPRRGIATGASSGAPRLHLTRPASARSHPGCVCANEAISAWPRRIHQHRCTRSRARDSSLAAPPTECLC